MALAKNHRRRQTNKSASRLRSSWCTTTRKAVKTKINRRKNKSRPTKKLPTKQTQCRHRDSQRRRTRHHIQTQNDSKGTDDTNDTNGINDDELDKELEYDEPTELSGVPWPEWVNDDPDPHDWASMFPLSSTSPPMCRRHNTTISLLPLSSYHGDSKRINDKLNQISDVDNADEDTSNSINPKFQLSPRMAARLMNEAIIIVDDVLLFGPKGGGESGDLPIILEQKIFVKSKKRRIQLIMCFERIILRLHKGLDPKPNCMGEVVALHILINKAQEALSSLATPSHCSTSKEESDNDDVEHLMPKNMCLPKSLHDKDFKSLREYLFDSDDMAAIDAIFTYNNHMIMDCDDSTVVVAVDGDDDVMEYLVAASDDSDTYCSGNDDDDDDDDDDSIFSFTDDMIDYTKQTILAVELYGHESPAFQTLLENFKKIRNKYWIMSPLEKQLEEEAKKYDDTKMKSSQRKHHYREYFCKHTVPLQTQKTRMKAYSKSKLLLLPGLESQFALENLESSKLLNLHPERWFIAFSKDKFANHICSA